MDIKERIAQEKAALEALEGKFTPDVCRYVASQGVPREWPGAKQ